MIRFGVTQITERYELGVCKWVVAEPLKKKKKKARHPVHERYRREMSDHSLRCQVCVVSFHACLRILLSALDG